MTTPQPNRLKGFARYFKDYMGAWSIVVAAMPVPVTALKLIPVYRAYRLPLSVYTPLFCFLLLGFIFFMRHQLAPLMFRRESGGTIGAGYFSFIPIGLILISFAAMIFYHITLRESVTKLSGVDRKASAEGVLEETALQVIPDGTTLMLFYLTFFLAAEGAFILMATKEYLQDEIGISD